MPLASARQRRAGIPGFSYSPAEQKSERTPIKAAWGAKTRVLRRKPSFFALQKWVLRYIAKKGRKKTFALARETQFTAHKREYKCHPPPRGMKPGNFRSAPAPRKTKRETKPAIRRSARWKVRNSESSLPELPGERSPTRRAGIPVFFGLARKIIRARAIKTRRVFASKTRKSL